MTALSVSHLDSSLAMSAVLLRCLETLSRSMRVSTFHVPMTRFFFYCSARPQGAKVSRSRLADQNYLGQAVLRPPFLGPYLTRVSSDVLKRLFNHLECCRSSPLPRVKYSDHWHGPQAAHVHACDQDFLSLPPPVSFATPQSPQDLRENLKCTDTCA